MAMQGVVQTRVRNVKTLLRYTGLSGRRIVEETIGDETRTIEWNAKNDYMATVEDDQSPIFCIPKPFLTDSASA